MEARTITNNGSGVFSHFFAQYGVSFVPFRRNGIHRAHANATAATNAFVFIDVRLAIRHMHRIMGAVPFALAATDTNVFLHERLTGAVLFHLTGARTATHAKVFNNAAKAGCFVTFKVCQGNYDVRFHQRTADFCFFYVFPVRHRHDNFVEPLQAVGNDNVSARIVRVEAILVRRFDVVKSVLAAPNI